MFSNSQASSVDSFIQARPELLKQEWETLKPLLKQSPYGNKLMQALAMPSSLDEEKLLKLLAPALMQYKLFPDIEEFVDTLSTSLMQEFDGSDGVDASEAKETAEERLWLIPTFDEDVRIMNRRPSLLAFKKKVENSMNYIGKPSQAEVDAKLAAALGLPSSALYSYSVAANAAKESAIRLDGARKNMFDPSQRRDTTQDLLQMLSAPSAAHVDVALPPVTTIPSQQIASDIAGQVMAHLSTAKIRTENFTVQVKTLTGKTIKLENLNSSDKVLRLKQMILQQDGIPVECQRLIYAGKQLEDHNDLQSYNICDRDTLHLVLRLRGTGEQPGPKSKKPSREAEAERSTSANSFEVYVRTLTGKTMTYSVTSSNTVQELKEKIQEREGIPSEQQRLIFAGKNLEAARMMQDYHVSDQCTMHLVLNLRSKPAKASTTSTRSTSSTISSFGSSAPTPSADSSSEQTAFGLASRASMASAAAATGASSVDGSFEVEICTLTGRRIMVNITGDKTVLDLKQGVHRQEGILVEQQRLIFKGVQLFDSMTLANYGINAEDNRVHLVLSLSTAPNVIATRGKKGKQEVPMKKEKKRDEEASSSDSRGKMKKKRSNKVAVEEEEEEEELAVAIPSAFVGWYQHGSVWIRGDPKTVQSATKIAGFDMDQTLIRVKSGRKFPNDVNDWAWNYVNVVEKITQLIKQNFRVVIFTNQNGIETGQQRLSDILLKIDQLCKAFGDSPTTPVYAFVATSKDKFRKPSPLLFDLFMKELNGNTPPGPDSFYVGDAAGRTGDHSFADRAFAHNVGLFLGTPLKFHTEDAYFLGKPDSAKWTYLEEEEVTQFKTIIMQTLQNPTASAQAYDIPRSAAPKEIVLMCGLPGSGKSTIFKTFFQPLGYVHINLDTVKVAKECMKQAKEAVLAGHSVVIDQTFPSAASRLPYLEIAKELNVPVRLIHLEVPIAVAKHLNKVRSWISTQSHVPDVAYHMYLKHFEAPHVKEGFESIVKLKFTITTTDPVILKPLLWQTD